MLQHNGVPDPVDTRNLYSGNESLPFCPNPLLILLLILLLTSLACSFVRHDARPASGELAISPHLPTLTRTPLPTLTPTLVSTHVAVAQEAESPEVALAAPPANDAAISPNTSMTEGASASTEDASAAATGAEAAGENPVPEPALAPPEASAGEGSASNELPAASSAETSSVQPLAALNNTPASLPTATTEPPTPTIPPTVTPTETPTAIPAPTETPSPTPLAISWIFKSVRLAPDRDGDNLLLYGNAINNTGTAQEIIGITGTFYDDQGQVIADPQHVLEYWPFVEIIPQEGSVSFELTVLGIDRTADFDLDIEAEPSDESPRQDFEFLDVGQSNDDDDYCLTGRLRNPGGALEDNVTIVAGLYDEQDNLINFGDYYDPFVDQLVGDHTLAFEICIDPLDQSVVRHELQAWGL